MPDVPKPPASVWFGIIGSITPLKGIDIFLTPLKGSPHKFPTHRF